MHAVSVGEVQACVELLKRLRAELPRTRLFVSTATLAGRKTAGQKLAGLADGIFFAPVDYVFAVRRVLRTLRPAVVLVVETEIWPNLFREAKRTGAALAIVNGRISDKALPKYLPYRWFFEHVLAAPDAILAQTPEHRDRFIALGAPADRVQTGGNFKYDFTPEPVELPLTGPVWIAASTMPPADASDVDEDDIVIAAHRELLASHPGLRLVLAPRKPERFDTVARKLEQAGLRYVRRTAMMPAEEIPSVLLLDTIGELAGLFGAATCVFMGGTLARRGGHNILEPAFFGKPVVTGPHMENFQAIRDEFHAAGAVVEIAAPAELTGAVARLLDSPADAAETGRRARECASARGGATARAVEDVRRLYRIPVWRPAQPWYSVAWLLSHVWRWGARRRQATAPRRLDVPVISIGNLSMGGTGKTPCVLRVAEELRERGHRPGILTRGHGRRSLESTLVIAPGAKVPVERSGDEPQIFIRSGVAPVGIGKDRGSAAQLLLRDFPVDVFVLDDGFQHVRLARDLDVVLVDALDPFAGGSVFPVGRLREPLDGLSRAGVLVITRADLADTPDAIERELRRWHPRATIFRATMEPEVWIEHRTGTSYPLDERPFRNAGAFCGLGNPESFRRTLESLGVTPGSWVAYGDHHHYRPRELRHLAHQMVTAGADAVITTQKDTINLCEASDELLAPLPLYWLKVRMRVEKEEEFFAEVERRLHC